MVESKNDLLGPTVEEDASQSCSPPTRQLDGFQQERADWELQRRREVEQLQREAAMLAEAWRRLESEQRFLLAERELLRQGVTRGSQPTFSRDAGPAVSQPAESTTPDAAVGGTNEQDHTAWLQFQQLRREMQRHGRMGP